MPFKKRRGMLTSGVAIFQINACLHSAVLIRLLIGQFNWELFVHLPYNSDPSPIDYHLFTYLKNWS
jgi:hypothetical protein